jgi:RNA polymerase sigma-70 factor (ECF subfamily)
LDESDELLRRCQQGDQSALTALVRQYQQRIFRLNLADEAAARTLEKVWSKAGQWQGRAGAGTWIYRVAYRTILDVQRARQSWWRRWAPGPFRLADQPSRRLEQEETAERVQAALAKLSPADRAVIHLYYFENLRLAELVPILGASADALKMRLARARERLRDLLEPSDG